MDIKAYLEHLAHKHDIMNPDRKVRAGNGGFEGARRNDPALLNWDYIHGNPDPHMLGDKDSLDDRVSDLVRNDGYLQAAAAFQKDSIIGPTYRLSANPAIRMLGLGENWLKEFREEVEEKFGAWANSADNWVDATRQNTFTELLRLGTGCFFATGETFMVADFDNSGKRPYRTVVQIIQNRRVRNPLDMTFDEDKVRGGIEFDRFGAPVAYYIRKADQNSIHDLRHMMKFRKVRAYTSWGRKIVIHVKEQNYPGQTRGISKSVAVIKNSRIAKTFRDLTLQQAAAAASFLMFVKSEFPPEVVMQMMEPGGAAAGQEFINNLFGSIKEFADGAEGQVIDGMKMPHLHPGTSIEVPQISKALASGVGENFEDSVLREIARANNMTLEQFTGDYRKVNYASARAANMMTHKGLMTTKKMVTDRIATDIATLWFEDAVHLGALETMTSRVVPNFYDKGMKDAYCRFSWIGASKGQIDGLKESQADALDVKMGFNTYKNIHAARGLDSDETWAQIKEEQGKLKDSGLIIQEDNGMNAVEGQSTGKEAKNPDREDGGDDD